MKSKIITSAFALATLLSATALPASAQVKLEQHMTVGMNRGDTEISNRITSLTSLQARIQGMKNLSDAQKTSFAASIQTQVTNMNSLLAKIKADTSTTSLRADLETIAPMYRIYLLVQPQVAILAASDRVNTIAGMLQALSVKFDARLAAHADASASAKLADLKIKIADATVQSQAATNEVISLQPDQGNKTVLESNTAALKDARAKIKVAMQDIQAAYNDARSIAQTLRASGGVSATSSASTGY